MQRNTNTLCDSFIFLAYMNHFYGNLWKMSEKAISQFQYTLDPDQLPIWMDANPPSASALGSIHSMGITRSRISISCVRLAGRCKDAVGVSSTAGGGGDGEEERAGLQGDKESSEKWFCRFDGPWITSYSDFRYEENACDGRGAAKYPGRSFWGVGFLLYSDPASSAGREIDREDRNDDSDAQASELNEFNLEWGCSSLELIWVRLSWPPRSSSMA